MEGTSLRIENSSRAHAESLNELLRTEYQTEVIQQNGFWQVEVQIGEIAELLLQLFNSLGSWLEAEHIDSILLHFDERQFTLLRPSKDRLQDSNGFLLERVAQLETALESRVVIEQAKGVIARALGVSTDQAFSLLRKACRDRGANIHDLAATVATSPMQAETILSNTPGDSS